MENHGHGYTWSKSWIEFKAPNAEGVYWLRNKEGKVLFVGHGRVRERLLSHWYKENPSDAALWNQSPTSFRFELTDHAARREAELIEELNPVCRPASQSFFARHWRAR